MPFPQLPYDKVLECVFKKEILRFPVEKKTPIIWGLKPVNRQTFLMKEAARDLRMY